MNASRFIEHPLSHWMRTEGNESEIVISSRVRIARNLLQHPFPLLATNHHLEQVQEELHAVLEDPKIHAFGKLHEIKLIETDELSRKMLVEKHLISPSLANESRSGAVYISEDESLSIMINEEDHLRIQCLYPGFQIQEAWEKASAVDDTFEEHVKFAFDDKRGYLTSCPTNVGTGLRASVMMHLPALVLTQQMNRILSAVAQIGLTVRGIYGEGSEAMGNLFQISNQITLGQNESEIIDNLRGVVIQIIGHEKAARERILDESRLRVIDRVMRSFGILSYAAIMDPKEAAQRLSDVRLGVDLGLIQGISPQSLNELMVLTQPGFLYKSFEGKMEMNEMDRFRAKLIRQKLGNRLK